ncbi:hypothetical protein CWC16_19825 [Pseudoalteromonas sp. S3776]|uniref:IS66 family insertion sequence element accessory protein TnpA n=1 Tax=Pseudoalteromonas sp. S3776 TaxID=579544 RepID=UPI001107DD20|nr:hypothetical protein [Pseudoalteromonas sp. S3776]TMO72342.1 hypothetical protein CWC16_19825 [Pseudoalteromonas sp. S3776]
MTQTSSSPKRLSKEQWQAQICEQQHGTVNQSEFCRSKGLCLATFNNWKRKLKPTEKAGTENSPHWVELPIVDQPSQAWDIELELPGNVILRMRQ